MIYYYSKELECIYIETRCDYEAQKENYCPSLWADRSYECIDHKIYRRVWSSKEYKPDNRAANSIRSQKMLCCNCPSELLIMLGDFPELELAIAAVKL